MTGDFVGRAVELASLARRIEAAAHGTGSVVLLAGPAGIGKSTLAAEALRRHAEPSGRTVVRGHCSRDEVAPPLWPWQQALRHAGVDPGLSARPSGPALSSTAHTAHAAEARFLELARMTAALTAAAAEHPLLVLLEDLHWADTASLDLLRQVARHGDNRGLLVLGTVREPVPEETAGALTDLRRYGADTLRLTPFSKEEVARCLGEPASGTARTEAKAEAAEDAYRRTGGLPLLVATLRAHASEDLGTVVSGLLTGLTDEQRGVVRAAAVLGERLEPGLLSAVLPEPDETVVAEALAAAWHAGVLTTAGSTADTGRAYRFAHDLVRDEVLGRTAPATTRSLHRAAARALELEQASAEDPAEAARIAAHWRRAGREPASRAAAARWSRTAAELALEQHAYDDAARHLAHAAAVRTPADPDRAAVLVELARAEYLCGRYDACLRHCEEAATAARENGQPELLADIALVLRGVSFPKASEAVVRLCRAALAVEDLPGAVRARLLAQLAAASADLGDLDAAVGHSRAAFALARSSGDPRAELDAARAVETTLAHPDGTSERLRLGELTVTRAERLGDPLSAVMGHEWRVQAGYLLGRPDLVDQAVRGIRDIAERCGLPLARWHLLRVSAARAVLEGRFDAARRHNEDAAELALAGGDETAIAMNHVLRLQLALVRGDAAELADDIWPLLDRAPHLPLPLYLSVRGRALFLAGRLDEAREAYARLRPMLPLPTVNPSWPAVLLHMVDLVALVGDVEGARLVYDQLSAIRPYPGALGTPTAYFSGTVSRDLGRLAAVAGRPAEAEELLREALLRNRALGARPDVALTCLDLATVLHDRGERDALAEAAALALKALAIARQLGQPGPASAAVHRLGEIAALRDETDPLTRREREIAEFVVLAHTNQEIAAHLFISERTVETHVSKILRKRGCANRTELVARWGAGKNGGPGGQSR
ncbi:AAA family ATPase [Streptomyces sp. NPDC058751]|uniref:helix-turn-helix transcriptional regulator n=1 Tax=Streptomyces sp. NPDC058751 TaxID=3346623 RepID=UPI00369EAA9D